MRGTAGENALRVWRRPIPSCRRRSQRRLDEGPVVRGHLDERVVGARLVNALLDARAQALRERGSVAGSFPSPRWPASSAARRCRLRCAVAPRARHARRTWPASRIGVVGAAQIDVLRLRVLLRAEVTAPEGELADRRVARSSAQGHLQQRHGAVEVAVLLERLAEQRQLRRSSGRGSPDDRARA
jgi:hypothetical protein